MLYKYYDKSNSNSFFFSSNMTKYKGGHSGPHVREILEKRVCVK